jgi:hypothetical protein
LNLHVAEVGEARVAAGAKTAGPVGLEGFSPAATARLLEAFPDLLISGGMT